MKFEPLAINPDDRPGMSWNNEIVKANTPDERICFMANAGALGDQHELNRYATLFAAAPALYDALRVLMIEIGEGGSRGRALDLLPRKSIEAAQAALASVKEG